MRSVLHYLSAFVDLLYPRLCAVCDTVLVTGERHICSRCLYNLPLDEEEHDDLILQFGELREIKAVYSLFRYHRFGKYRNLIYAVKYRSNKELGVMLGEMLGQRIPPETKIDVLLPLPLHPKREKERGYNQADLIARGISNVLGIPLERNVVSRVTNNPSQTGLTREERAKNVQHIFRLHEVSRLAGRHVLIVDDVITTGATLASLLTELSEVPELEVSVACLARAKDG